MVVAQEGGPSKSLTIREIFRRYYQLDIGLYTYWPYWKPGVLHSGTIIGRHSYIADTVRTFTRNHPMNLRSTHAFFYNPALGIVKGDPIKFSQLRIGNGVLIDHNAIILHPTSNIGDGAIVTAGSVVCSNVPPYAIVAGFPARVTGYRFDKGIVAKLLVSKWWVQSPEELRSDPKLMRSLMEESGSAELSCVARSDQAGGLSGGKSVLSFD